MNTALTRITNLIRAIAILACAGILPACACLPGQTADSFAASGLAHRDKGTGATNCEYADGWETGTGGAAM